jgi:hypothetical protein
MRWETAHLPLLLVPYVHPPRVRGLVGVFRYSGGGDGRRGGGLVGQYHLGDYRHIRGFKIEAIDDITATLGPGGEGGGLFVRVIRPAESERPLSVPQNRFSGQKTEKPIPLFGPTTFYILVCDKLSDALFRPSQKLRITATWDKPLIYRRLVT